MDIKIKLISILLKCKIAKITLIKFVDKDILSVEYFYMNRYLDICGNAYIMHMHFVYLYASNFPFVNIKR